MSNEETPKTATGNVTENSVLSMVHSGQLSKDPQAKLDSRIYDPITQQPVLVGNVDPTVISADDSYDFSYRKPDSYPEVPTQVKTAETRFVLPMAKFLADTLGITVLDETAYERVLPALRSRSLFVILNIHKTLVADGVASWFGMILMCKRHPVVMTRLKMKLATEQIGIDQIRLWERGGERYVLHREPNGGFFSREESSATILTYLRREGVLPNI